MSERYYFNAFWGTRVESAEHCAARTLRMLEELRGIHELFAHWYEKGWTREQALEQRVELSQDALLASFKNHMLFPDQPEHGYSLGWWNGADDDQAMDVSFSVGSKATPACCNSVLLYLPTRPSAADSLFEPDVLLAALTAVVRAWEPEWSTFTTLEFQERVDPDEEIRHKPNMGWLVYLCAERLRGLRASMPCAEIIHLDDLGAIFVLTRAHRPLIDNPDEVAAARALMNALADIGALDDIATSWDD